MNLDTRIYFSQRILLARGELDILDPIFKRCAEIVISGKDLQRLKLHLQVINNLTNDIKNITTELETTMIEDALQKDSD